MGKTAVIACIVVLIQVHLDIGQAAPQVNIKQTTTYKFRIDHALDMAYQTDAQRDALLQQVFSVWKTVLATYSASNLKIKFLQHTHSVDPDHMIVQYRVSGDSSSEVHLQDATTAFESQLSSSGIAGVMTLAQLGLTSGANGNQIEGPNQLTQWNVDITLIVTGSNSLDDYSQQIFSLWQSTFGSRGFADQKITTTSQVQSANGQTVTYRINGSSKSPVDITSLVAAFATALQNANIVGLDLTPLLTQVNPGSVDNVVNGGSSSGGRPFTVNNQQVQISATSDSDLQDFLNQILALWKTTLSQSQVTNVQINVVSKTRLPNNQGYKVVYSITGQSQSPVNVQQVSTQFISSFNSINIGGVTLVPSGGSSVTNNKPMTGLIQPTPFTISNQQLQLTYNSDADLSNLLQQILSVWKTVFGYDATSQATNLKIKTISKTPVGNNVYNVVYQITGQAANPVNSQDMSSQFISQLSQSSINNVNLVDTDVGGVVNNLNNGGSNVATGLIQLSPFTIDNQQLQLTYKNDAGLNNLLQQILSVWKTVFGNLDSAFNVQNLNIKAISKKPLGNNVYNVVYQITGQSGQPINNQDMSSQFLSQLSMSSINNVNLVGTNTGSTVNKVVNGGTNGLIGGGGLNLIGGGGSMSQGQSMGGGGMNQNQNMGGGGMLWNGGNTPANVDRSGDKAGKNFQFTQDILLQFTNNAQRDQFLQGQILGMWKYATGVYDASKIKLVFLTSQPADNIGPNFQTVTYRVTGTSDQPLDQQTVLNSYFQAVTNGGFDAIKLPAGLWSGSAGSAAFNGVDNNGGSGGASFQVDSSSLLTYTSASQRDSLLQQLLNLFKTTFASQQLSSVSIVFIREAAGQGNAKQVFYRITGQSGQGPLDVPSATDQFNQAISNAGIKNIAVNIVGAASNAGTNTIGLITGGGPGSNDANPVPFQLEDSVVFSAQSQSQRNAYLQQLLALFKTTFGQFGLTNVNIVIVSDKASASSIGARQISYRITGTASPDLVHDKFFLTSVFRKAISDANLAGISLVSGGSTSGSFPVDFFDDTLALTYTSDAQRDQLLQQVLAQWKTVLSQYQISNLKIQFDSVKNTWPHGEKVVRYHITGSSSTQFSYNDVLSAFQQAITTANIDGVQWAADAENTSDAGSGSFPISITRNDLALTYTTSLQRDNLLKQILSLWKTVFAQYSATNLQIKFVSESAQDAAGGRTVTYIITGTAGVQFDLNTLIQAFLSALQGSPIAGVSLAGAAVKQVVSNVGAVLGGNGGPFSIPGSLKLTYKNDQQRDTFLNQVLVMWRNSIWAYQVSDVKIKMTGVTGVAPTRTVSYVVTGTSALPIDLQAATDLFQSTLRDAHLTGIQYA